MNNYQVIAIDGPSGSGKGTVSRAVACALNFNYLDSGAIYRALAYLVAKHNFNEHNLTEILHLVTTMQLEFKGGKTYLDEEDITLKLRQEQVAMLASRLAADPSIRDSLLDYQRQFATKGNLVTDGRDMATTVFPDAVLKIFLTASVKERACRRLKELQLSGSSVKMEGILQDIILRDQQDSERASSPLKFTSVYKLLDNTNLTIDECVSQIILLYNQIVSR